MNARIHTLMEVCHFRCTCTHPEKFDSRNPIGDKTDPLPNEIIAESLPVAVTAHEAAAHVSHFEAIMSSERAVLLFTGDLGLRLRPEGAAEAETETLQ